MDYLALWLCGRILHSPIYPLRLALSALIGGLYALAVLIWPGNPILLQILNLLIPFLLCYVAFGWDNFRRYGKHCLLFWGFSFLIGGGMTAIFYLFSEISGVRRISMGGSVETVYTRLPLWVFGLLALFCALLSLLWGRFSKQASNKREIELEIQDEAVKIRLHGFLDSGNLLTEPLSGVPVIFINRETMNLFLPSGVVLGNLSPSQSRRIRLIPYHSVGGSGILTGYIPQKIWADGAEVRAALCCDPSRNDFSGYEALCPSQLL
jgi:stage II sporulation protein GA (sporulation sigma-E factor processing peptidase)